MKILAIRGENLASLDGRFEVQLDAPPLAGAGVFAITGPTGAGKTTILDAMCLALFGTAPRFEHATGKLRNGDEELTARDARNVLRRGAGEGFAEVDLVTGRGLRLRATWTVRRGRKKPSGKLQSAERRVVMLDTGAVLADGIEPSKAVIAAHLGLTYEQFTRSVLLPQGGFAALLRAPEADRAKILEAMTGTEIYTRISAEAYRRAQEEQRTLDQILARERVALPLSEERRVEAEVARTAAEAAKLEQQQHLERTEKRVGLFVELAARTARVVEAEAQHARALAAREAAATLRAELSEARASLGLRAQLEGLDAVRQREGVAQRAWQRVELERETSAARVAQAASRLDEAARADSEARAAREVAEPKLRAASERTAWLEAAAPERAREAEALSRAVGLEQEATSALARVKSRATENAANLAEHVRYLDTHRAEVEFFARTWSTAQRHLAQYEQLHDGRARAEARLAAAKSARDAADVTWAQARTAADAARVALAGAEADEQAAAASVEAAGALESLAPDAAACAAEVAQLEAARGLAVELEGARQRRERDGLRASRAREAAAHAEEEGASAEAASRELEVRHAQTARLADRVRTQLGLAEHRARLVAGEACPLCGATDHPLAGHAPRSAALGELEAELALLEASLRKERERSVAARTAAIERRREAEQAESDADAQRANIARLEARWTGAHAAWPAEAVALEAALDGARARAELAASRVRAAQEASVRQVAAREAAQRARAEVHAAETRVLGAERAHNAAEAEARDAEQEARRLESDLDALLDALDRSASGKRTWKERFDRSPREARRRLGEQVRAWEEHERGVQQQRALEVELARDTLTAEQAVQAATDARDAAARALDVRDAQLAAWRAERETILGGEPAGSLDARTARAIVEAARSLSDSRTALEQARLAHAELDARARTAQALAAAETTARQAAETQLETALEAAALDETRARAHLARGAAWIDAREAELAALDVAVQTLAVRVAERIAERDAHRALLPAELDEPTARAERDAAVAALDTAQTTLAERALAIREDDRIRAELARLGPELRVVRERAAVWARLSDLVGSADGAKLRNFAQSLTLDVLVEQASARLRDLAPRYRLERAEKQNLQLVVVDHDMGDEVRGVESLSGGESFLVSLALALGLAALSVHDARLESLFVDEGFGTLDPDTLQTALGALEALQQEGCQIGLISHVDGLAESLLAAVHVVPQGAGTSRVEVR